MYQGLKNHCLLKPLNISLIAYRLQPWSQQMKKITTLTTTEICLKSHLINILSGQSNISTKRKNLCI